jgi:DNA invertase Pin-like site-specific DNA recombinase
MNNSIIYTRFSPRPEKVGDAERIAANEDAESIRLQLDVCHRYAVMKNLIVTETIKDPETSARQTPLFERNGGSQLQFLPRGTHVICSKLDRVFRSTADGLLTMNHFKKQGVIMHFADQSGCTLDLSTGEGEFMFTVLLAAASLEPRRTADRTSKAMKHRQGNGQRMTSAKTIPFGQMADPNDDALTIPCPAELDAVNIACAMKSHGHSLRDIAKELGPIRGKTLSPQSVKILISRSTEHESFRFV